jgi:F-box protein 18 (helicase)
MSKFPPTAEQQAIIDCKFGTTDVIKVKAFAGTGKTTTLTMFAAAHPELKMLYVAFSKAVQLEAFGRFPSNVLCKTSHSLAYANFGSKYQKKMCMGSLKIKTVAEAFGWKKWETAKYTIGTMMNFIASADKEIAGKHVPPEGRLVAARARAEAAGKDFDLASFDADTENASDSDFVNNAKALWKRMCDPKDFAIEMLHDGYLKLWQLSKPTLRYDVILLDEAQDINPATADVVMGQNCVRILVGDVHQQIYSFRGADNILAKMKSQHDYALTQSFRFGKKIGILASLILKTFKGEPKSVVGRNGEGELKSVDSNKKYTIITRTNAVLFSQAVNLFENKKLGFVGGVYGYKFDEILDTYHLFDGKKHLIKDSYIRSFASYQEMEAFATEVDDLELKSRIGVVNTYQDRIPYLINQITNTAVDVSRADVVLTTGHKAKGLEFDQVVLTDDFPQLIKESEETGEEFIVSGLAPDEYNLIYVACTRAIKRLQVPGRIVSFLEFIKKADILDEDDPA